jgi:hypothetical protein
MVLVDYTGIFFKFSNILTDVHMLLQHIILTLNQIVFVFFFLYAAIFRRSRTNQFYSFDPTYDQTHELVLLLYKYVKENN